MKTSILKKALLLAFVVISGQAFAQNVCDIVWVKAEATPVDGGLVYVNWNYEGDEIPEDFVSEFYRAVNIGASTAFIVAEPNVADGWMLAGFARDTNKNGRYDNGEDQQFYVRPDGFFTAKIYPESYNGDGSSSSSAQIEAEAALADKIANEEEPSDRVYAVFTQGDIAMQAEDQEWYGKVWSSKLNNEIGDEVTFTAVGESFVPQTGSNKYFKFDHWTIPGGETLYTRSITVTVSGGEIYYAHFVETTKEDFNNNERNTAIDPVFKGSRTFGSKFYNLQGQVVEPSAKGVYIQNGKKVVLK